MKAIVWRKSVYDTGACPLCGERLRDKNGDPMGSVLFDEEAERFYCPRCGKYVARMEDYDGPVPPDHRGGEWKGGGNGMA